MEMEPSREVGRPGPREGRGMGHDHVRTVDKRAVDGTALGRQNQQGYEQQFSKYSSCACNTDLK